jgi:hypothetical protein
MRTERIAREKVLRAESQTRNVEKRKRMAQMQADGKTWQDAIREKVEREKQSK